MDRYLAVRKLGQGSYGEVTLVQALAGSGLIPGELYALKRVPLGQGDGVQAGKVAADTEVKIGERLEHPYIVQYFGSFVDDRTCHLLFEYVPHGDLHHYLELHPTPPEPQIWTWLSQLLQALSYLHSHRILHRDLKPTNIFLASENCLKLGDFGVARVLDYSGELAKTGVGTPFYLAPEVWKGTGYDTKADMWSLGCILYQLCTGRRPFGGGLGELVQKVLCEDFEPISHRYSLEVRGVVGSLLRKDPGERPSAEALLRHPWVAKLVESDSRTAWICSEKLGKRPYFRSISINIPTQPSTIQAENDEKTTAKAAICTKAELSESAETEKAQQIRHFTFPESILKQCPRSPNRPALMSNFLRQKLGIAVFEQLTEIVGRMANAGEVLKREPWVFSTICGRENLPMVDVGIAFEAFRTLRQSVSK